MAAVTERVMLITRLTGILSTGLERKDGLDMKMLERKNELDPISH